MGKYFILPERNQEATGDMNKERDMKYWDRPLKDRLWRKNVRVHLWNTTLQITISIHRGRFWNMAIRFAISIDRKERKD